MKKLFPVLAFAMIMTFASCKKDHTCTCTYSSGDPDIYQLPDTKKGDAEDACDQLEIGAKILDPSASCSI